MIDLLEAPQEELDPVKTVDKVLQIFLCRHHDVWVIGHVRLEAPEVMDKFFERFEDAMSYVPEVPLAA